MARKKIPEKDKRKVIERIAQGHSLRQAIKGTAVSSSSTANRLVKSIDIAQLKSEYMGYIEGEFKVDRRKRAELLAEMAVAMRIKGSMTEPDKWVPDYKIRLEALKYIDKIGGINIDEPPQVNVTTPVLVVDRNVRTDPPTA